MPFIKLSDSIQNDGTYLEVKKIVEDNNSYYNVRFRTLKGEDCNLNVLNRTTLCVLLEDIKQQLEIVKNNTQDEFRRLHIGNMIQVLDQYIRIP
jgi:hypothetical protein